MRGIDQMVSQYRRYQTFSFEHRILPRNAIRTPSYTSAMSSKTSVHSGMLQRAHSIGMMLERSVTHQFLRQIRYSGGAPLLTSPFVKASGRRGQHAGSLARPSSDAGPYGPLPTAEPCSPSALKRLPTFNIIRTLLLGKVLSSPFLFKYGFAAMQRVANSSSPFLNPDKNPILRFLIKPFFYDQFCAGRNEAEVRESVSRIQSLGFSGVILTYSKETEWEKLKKQGVSTQLTAPSMDEEVAFWKRENLRTLGMMGEGDFLAIKLSGVGTAVTDALLNDSPQPVQVMQAMDAIAESASRKRCLIIIDAEQQTLQTAIDKWTIDLMRKHNVGGKVLVYNSLQSYLKVSRQKLTDQLSLAQKEGWTLAVKLVRGAYIGSDERSLIHDTKPDTDACYNSIVRDILQGALPGFSKAAFPKMELFIAGHNKASVDAAYTLTQELAAKGELKVIPEFGQLQGMADELGCSLVSKSEEARRDAKSALPPVRVFKCLSWGSIQECMQYMLRRAIENSGAAEGMKDDMAAMGREFRRRLFGRLASRG